MVITTFVAAGAALVLAAPQPITLSPTPVAVVDRNSDWPTQAHATAAALSSQLEILAQAEDAWAAFEAAHPDTPPPAALEPLLERKALLVRQRAVLESELVTWAAVPPAVAAVADYDEQIAELDRQLARPVPETVSAGYEASVSALRRERDALAARRDTKLGELALLQRGVEESRARPLPDARDLTLPLASEVVEAINAEAERDQPWWRLW